LGAPYNFFFCRDDHHKQTAEAGGRRLRLVVDQFSRG
jgi:hypothetical protein